MLWILGARESEPIETPNLFKYRTSYAIMALIDDEEERLLAAPTIQGLLEEIDRTVQRWIEEHPDGGALFISLIDGAGADSGGTPEGTITVESEGFNPRFDGANWIQKIWLTLG